MVLDTGATLRVRWLCSSAYVDSYTSFNVREGFPRRYAMVEVVVPQTLTSP